MSSDANYALVGNEKNGDFVLFIGNGTQLEANGIKVSALEEGNVVVEQKDSVWKLHNEVPVVISNGKNQMIRRATEHPTSRLRRTDQPSVVRSGIRGGTWALHPTRHIVPTCYHACRTGRRHSVSSCEPVAVFRACRCPRRTMRSARHQPDYYRNATELLCRRGRTMGTSGGAARAGGALASPYVSSAASNRCRRQLPSVRNALNGVGRVRA